MEAYETIGGMFKDIKQDYIEHNLNERLWLAIIEILSVLELIIGNIDFEETIGKLILYSDSLGFLHNTQIPINSTKLAA